MWLVAGAAVVAPALVLPEAAEEAAGVDEEAAGVDEESAGVDEEAAGVDEAVLEDEAAGVG